MGRCHASQLVGSKLVMFGGSLDMGNTVTWLDLDALTWGSPLVLGTPPVKRMSAAMALSGTDLLVFGGWNYYLGEVSVQLDAGHATCHSCVVNACYLIAFRMIICHCAKSLQP